jgi:hypothetical protein
MTVADKLNAAMTGDAHRSYIRSLHMALAECDWPLDRFVVERRSNSIQCEIAMYGLSVRFEADPFGLSASKFAARDLAVEHLNVAHKSIMQAHVARGGKP